MATGRPAAQAIDVLAERGIVPTVEMGWEWTPEGAMAMARTLQEAGRPVYLLIPQAELIERGAYRDTAVWSEGPDASRGGRGGGGPACRSRTRGRRPSGCRRSSGRTGTPASG